MLISITAFLASLPGLVITQAPPSKGYINATNNDDSKVSLNIGVRTGGRNATAPLLYGWMIEDISHSIDGGLYGELIYNRAFQGSGVTTGKLPNYNGTVILESENAAEPFGPVLKGYRSIGGARLSLDRVHPLSAALPTVMQVKFPLDATDEVGFLNEGFYGMAVSEQTYNASFYILAGGPFDAANLTHLNVSLRSGLTEDVFATRSIAVTNGSISDLCYTQLNAQIENRARAPNSNNTFAVTFNGTEVAGKTFYFSLISLFPETFKDRPNGMRNDLAEAIYELNPKFLRFPGGNNLEGISVQDRFRWERTIGPLIERPGRTGTWTYYNTDGFGLLEYLQWTEDMEMERILGIYAGYSLDISGAEGVSVSQDDMAEILQSALDELEYCMGPANSTFFGALRADHGHPAAFPIPYLEIGNEDGFSGSYPRRFRYLHDGIKAHYPAITIISTTFDENPEYKIDLPPGSMYDLHDYRQPSFFLTNRFSFFDNWPQETNNTANITLLAGEYSAPSIDDKTGIVNFNLTDPATTGIHVYDPSLLSATAEAVYLLAMERNPNLVKLSSFAPSLGNMNAWQWKPDLLTFDADPHHTVRSISYYVQKLFNSFHGTHTLPVTNTAGDLNPLFWVASIDQPSGAVYLKVVNTLNQSVPIEMRLDTPVRRGVNGTIITDQNVSRYNYLGDQEAVIPRPIDLPGGGLLSGNESFEWVVPAFSINVLQFDV